MNIPRCPDCSRPVSRNAGRCKSCAQKKKWADGAFANVPEIHPITPIAQRSDRAPRTLRRKSRAWHAAGGGTEQFSLTEYDRRMEER